MVYMVLSEDMVKMVIVCKQINCNDCIYRSHTSCIRKPMAAH